MPEIVAQAADVLPRVRVVKILLDIEGSWVKQINIDEESRVTLMGELKTDTRIVTVMLLLSDFLVDFRGNVDLLYKIRKKEWASNLLTLYLYMHQA